jgi:hypothetical protein
MNLEDYLRRLHELAEREKKRNEHKGGSDATRSGPFDLYH